MNAWKSIRESSEKNREKISWREELIQNACLQVIAELRFQDSPFLHPEGVFPVSAKTIIIKPEPIDIFADDMVYYVID